MMLFEASVGLRQVGRFWFAARDGNEAGLELFRRHYSRRIYRDGRNPKLYVGPGRKVVLLSERGDALWVWRKFLSDDGQDGVNCAVFRNESAIRSSELILDAEQVALLHFPSESRFYTYVNPRMVRSSNPGCCFRKAGWRRCGTTKAGLFIFEKIRA